jgi:hypothetical protein
LFTTRSWTCDFKQDKFLYLKLYSNFINTFMVMVFDATINNISAISWQSVLLVEEIGVPGEHHRHAASH